MALVFAAIVPHPPFLLPGLLEKKEAKALSHTQQAMTLLTEHFYLAQPDIAIVLSQHGPVDSTSFSINLAQKFETNFESFGDLKTKASFASDSETTALFKEGSYEDDLPLRLIHEPTLDYGSAIPLLTLSQPLPNLRVIPLVPSQLPYATHRRWGANLFRWIAASPKRIGVFASIDLSHQLTPDAPGGFNPQAVEAMKRILHHLEDASFGPIFSMDEKEGDAMFECGLRPLITLLGIIEHLYFEPKLLSYEAPLGVGYVVLEFDKLG